MSQLHPDDALLHRFYDGELSPEEAASLQSHIDQDEGSLAKLEALQELGSILRANAQDAALPDADDLFAAIEGQLENPADELPVSRPQLRVVGGSKLPEAKPQHAPGYMILALAAVALLTFWFLPSDSDESASEVAAIQDPISPVELDEESSLVLIDTTPSGSEVLAVDFGQNTGTSFTVEGEVGQPVAVLWIMDEESTL
jgi:hypothetical protein